MIPGNMDPRRPEKVQRYKAPQANGNAPVEDLTPDYMNILGPDSATANAEGATEHVKSAESNAEHTAESSTSTMNQEPTTTTLVQSSNGTNVIPTSPQYGVAIISNNVNDIPSETTTSSTDTVIETTAKSEGDIKDMHSTPSRNDRFKVVKIASLEPFRRGRWKCMDYVDENPPTTSSQSKTSQSQSNIQLGGNMYMQTQSLPQQHFQQMLVQGGYTNQPQFYQNIPSQMMQSQYFYPSQNVGSMQHIQVQPNNIPPQFINANQQYFPPNVVPHSAGYNYQNVQYVASNIIPNQTSAFVSTTQNVNPQLPPNFQQSQTYAGPPSSNQTNIQQPMVNGHAYPTQNETQPVPSSLPTQVAKNVILANLPQNPNQSQMNQAIQQQQQQQNMGQSNSLPQSSQINQQYNPNTGGYQNVINPPNTNTQPNINQVSATLPVASTGTPGGPIVSAVAHQLSTSVHLGHAPSGNSVTTSASLPPPTSVHFTHNFPASHIQHPQMQTQHYDPNFATNVYTNPQFVASVNSLPLPDIGEMQGDNADSNLVDGENASGEDPGKMNPVVNAIDNKIEQAMDLVKSHLMYTVREEVEVLKEKIAELMERIQQLESENSHLKQQIPPKGSNNNNPIGGSDPPPPPSQ